MTVAKTTDMEIDFHHSTTYVLSRLAGFSAKDAYIIACSSQYVDDAGSAFITPYSKSPNRNTISFTNFHVFEFINSSLYSLNFLNRDELDQSKAAIPFHFLPSNIGHRFTEKIACAKAKTDDSAAWNNLIARDMVQELIDNVELGENKEGLYRLGITMKVLADTYAHQQFVGINIPGVNGVRNIQIIAPDGSPMKEVLDIAPKLSLKKALKFSGLPFQHWKYENNDGQIIVRNNPVDFLAAAKLLYEVLRVYHDKYFDVNSMSENEINEDFETIAKLFSGLANKSGLVRDAEWVKNIKSGSFICCPEGEMEQTDYFAEKETGSWWDEVSRMCPMSESSMWQILGYRKYNKIFLTSKYKLFHNALIHHNNFISKQLIPIFDLCLV